MYECSGKTIWIKKENYDSRDTYNKIEQIYDYVENNFSNEDRKKHLYIVT